MFTHYVHIAIKSSNEYESLSSACAIRIQPAVGLSDVSDPFLLRTGISYMFN